MANFVFNIALGRGVQYYDNVKSNTPANSAFILIPIETSGLETDAVLRDADTVAAVLAGTTNEQTTMGRKTLTDVELATLPAPDDVNDRYGLNLPAVTWTAASGNAISKILVAYDADTTAGTDANLIPVTMFDASLTPSGIDFTLNSSEFYRAQAL